MFVSLYCLQFCWCTFVYMLHKPLVQVGTGKPVEITPTRLKPTLCCSAFGAHTLFLQGRYADSHRGGGFRRPRSGQQTWNKPGFLDIYCARAVFSQLPIPKPSQYKNPLVSSLRGLFHRLEFGFTLSSSCQLLEPDMDLVLVSKMHHGR